MKKVLYVGKEEFTEESAKNILDEYGEYELFIYMIENEDYDLLDKFVSECNIICYNYDVRDILDRYDVDDKILVEM